MLNKKLFILYVTILSITVTFLILIFIFSILRMQITCVEKKSKKKEKSHHQHVEPKADQPKSTFAIYFLIFCAIIPMVFVMLRIFDQKLIYQNFNFEFEPVNLRQQKFSNPENSCLQVFKGVGVDISASRIIRFYTSIL
jgi:ABC-type Fe3+ transport system permease subunit